MNADAVLAIRDLAREAPVIVRSPDYEHTGLYYQRDADGAYSPETAYVRGPQPKFLTVEALARFVTLAPIKDAAVLVGPRLVSVLATDAGVGVPVDWHLALDEHPAYTAVEATEPTMVFDQRGLIRHLRARLNGHVDDVVVERFRVVNLKGTRDGQNVVRQGREGVDRSILQEVVDRAGGDLPDAIEAEVPVFDLRDTRHLRYPVRMLVDVVPRDDSVVFEVTADVTSLRAARDAALDEIVALLESSLPATIPVLRAAMR